MPLRIVTCALLVLTGTAHAATFVVNSAGDQGNADPGNGSAEISPGTGIVTLRSAIEEANALAGTHTIRFNRFLVVRIQPVTPLPPILRSGLTILGEGMILDGRNITGTFQDPDGLDIRTSNVTVDRMTITRFRGNGIRISGESALNNLVRGCTIGGVLGEGNLLAGIRLDGGAQGNQIGGQGLLEANVIAGNGLAGIVADGEFTSSNMFVRNRIFENGAGPRGIVLTGDAQDSVAPPELQGINPVRGRTAPNGQVELFVDKGGQGETYLATVFADGTGRFEVNLDLREFTQKPAQDFQPTVPFTRFLTATTMDMNGNTSAFSNALLIRGNPLPESTKLRYRRFVDGDQSFEPGDSLLITVEANRFGPTTSNDLEIVEVIPDGWTLVNSTADGATVLPAAGSGPVLRWAFNDLPGTGRSVSYEVSIPEEAQGLDAIEGQAQMTDFGAQAVASKRVRTELLQSGFSNIQGRVVELDTERPITCATAEYVQLDSPGETFSAVVDSSGRYQFPMLPQGEYERRVLAPGYSGAVVRQVTLDTPFIIVTHKLNPITNQAILVRGIVTDADTGLPLSGVFVQARSGNTVLATTYTCASGFYAIPRPSSQSKQSGSTVEVDFSADNYEPATQSVDVPDTEAGEANQGLSKASFFPSSLVGMVSSTKSSDTPAEAQVLIQGPVNTTAPVKSDGTYLFDAILDGTYLVRANAPNFETSVKTIVVGQGVVETLNFSLTPTPPPVNPHDINSDGVVNAVDVQLVINAALGISIEPFNGDVNDDGKVNAVDVQLVINAALGII